VAKLSLKQREAKREKLVAQYAKKYAELKAVIDDAKRSPTRSAMPARLELQKLPRNANPTRLRNRCALTGSRRAARSACSVWAATRSASSPSRATSRA
jgi:small subunit ribosomal protein S14